LSLAPGFLKMQGRDYGTGTPSEKRSSPSAASMSCVRRLANMLVAGVAVPKVNAEFNIRRNAIA